MQKKRVCARLICCQYCSLGELVLQGALWWTTPVPRKLQEWRRAQHTGAGSASTVPQRTLGASCRFESSGEHGKLVLGMQCAARVPEGGETKPQRSMLPCFTQDDWLCLSTDAAPVSRPEVGSRPARQAQAARQSSQSGVRRRLVTLFSDWFNPPPFHRRLPSVAVETAAVPRSATRPCRRCLWPISAWPRFQRPRLAASCGRAAG